MIWIIYRHRDKLEAPSAIPFENDSYDLVQEWIEQQEKVEILDVAESED